jgi:phosphate transport system substrate-binding protein
MVRWVDDYRRSHPMVRIDVSAGGAGKGVADVLAGMVDLGMVSRNIRNDERQQDLVAFAVVRDAVVATVSAENPAVALLARTGLKRRQFGDAFLGRPALTWGGLLGSSEPGPVRVYTRSDACGAAETWAAFLGAQQSQIRGTAVYGDPALAEAVRRDPLAIGFNNVGFAYDAATGRPLQGLAIVPIDVNENGRVDPEEVLGSRDAALDAVRRGVYPSPPARPLFLVARGVIGAATGEFLRWVLTEGQRLVEQSGYVRLAQEDIRAGLSELGPPLAVRPGRGN